VEPWQILVGVASFALVAVTVVLARSGSVPVPAATARICGYAVTGTLTLIGVPALLAIVPAMVGVVVAYVLVLRAPRPGRDAP